MIYSNTCIIGPFTAIPKNVNDGPVGIEIYHGATLVDRIMLDSRGSVDNWDSERTREYLVSWLTDGPKNHDLIVDLVLSGYDITRHIQRLVEDLEQIHLEYAEIEENIQWMQERHIIALKRLEQMENES